MLTYKANNDYGKYLEFISNAITVALNEAMKDIMYNDDNMSSPNTYKMFSNQKKQKILWTYRQRFIETYNILYMIHNNDMLSLILWIQFWEKYIDIKQNENMYETITIPKDIEYNIAKYMYQLFTYYDDKSILSNNISSMHWLTLNTNELKLFKYCHEIPSFILTQLKIPTSFQSIYLELFLLYYVTIPAYTWTLNIDDDSDDDVTKNKSSLESIKQVIKDTYNYNNNDNNKIFDGYNWKDLLNVDAIKTWLRDSNYSGYGGNGADWNHDKFESFLSNPLNQIELKYFEIIQYFAHNGGLLVGILRDFVKNTTQHTHGFLICRIADAIYNNKIPKYIRKRKKKLKEITNPSQKKEIIRNSEEFDNVKKSEIKDDNTSDDSSNDVKNATHPDDIEDETQNKNNNSNNNGETNDDINENNNDNINESKENNNSNVNDNGSSTPKVNGNNSDNDISLSDNNDDSGDVNNEWVVFASRLLKLKIYFYLMPYNYHIQCGNDNVILTSPTYVLIPLKKILHKYSRYGYSLSDFDSELTLPKLLSKYILNEMENDMLPKNKKQQDMYESKEGSIQNDKMQRFKKGDPKEIAYQNKVREYESTNLNWVETIMFMLDVTQNILKNQYDFNKIKQYIINKQKQFDIEYLSDEFIDNIVLNIVLIIRIIPDHFKMEYIIFY